VEYGEEEYEAVDSRDIRKQETLKIIGSKGEITQIYTVPENIVPWYGKIGAVRFSLGGNYVCFIEDGWENTKLMIVNVQTKKNILKDIDSWFNRLDIYQNIFWSQNEKVLAIKSYWSSFSGEGRDGIFVSDYGKPEKLNQVFTFGEGFKAMEFEDGSEIYNIRLMSDEKLYFSVKFAPYEGETYEKKYEYIVKTKELKEVK
jgi:hypothetical protein